MSIRLIPVLTDERLAPSTELYIRRSDETRSTRFFARQRRTVVEIAREIAVEQTTKSQHRSDVHGLPFSYRRRPAPDDVRASRLRGPAAFGSRRTSRRRRLARRRRGRSASRCRRRRAAGDAPRARGLKSAHAGGHAITRTSGP